MDDATTADLIDLLLRTASTVSGFSAAGSAWFILVFGRDLVASAPRLRRGARRAALAALPLLAAHLAMQAARMGGEMPALADPGLQRLALGSALAGGVAIQGTGLLALYFGLRATTRVGLIVAVSGAVLLAAGFLATGHIAIHPRRWLLAPLLLAHLLLVQFWLGALYALRIATREEARAAAAALTARFSQRASWLVPLIPVAGAAMAMVLLPGWSAFAQPYGRFLLAKIALFAVLLALAALNRWHFGPALARPDGAGAGALRRVILAEALLLVTVFGVTFAMTAWTSPT
jgi:putative copper export protein